MSISRDCERIIMLKIPGLQSAAERYIAIPFEPISITVMLKQAIIFYDPLYLDNLLARCVLESVQGDAILGNTPEPYWFPLPLKMLWCADNGCPLWAASVFLPEGKVITDMVYFHKRTERFEFSEKQPKSNVGRWMSRRIPYQTQQAETKRWAAYCIGNAEEIGKLLSNVRFLGKRRNVGFGEVDHFDIQPWDGKPIDTMVQDGKLVHAIPQECSLVATRTAPVLVGWTPPQWKPSLFSMGWPVGTEATVKE